MRQPLPCGSENLDIIMAEGGDITARDKLGRTALHYASQASHVRTVRRLLDLLGREMVDEVDIDGWTPLCRALRGTESLVDEIRAGEAANAIETMRILIKRGVNRYIQCHIGDQHWSLLQIAQYCGAQESIITAIGNSTEFGEEKDFRETYLKDCTLLQEATTLSTIFFFVPSHHHLLMNKRYHYYSLLAKSIFHFSNIKIEDVGHHLQVWSLLLFLILCKVPSLSGYYTRQIPRSNAQEMRQRI